MSEALPRLKPDPIPSIHPVPEYAVTGDRKAVYEATKSGLGVPWMGVVTMAFAHYPTFYGALWNAMEPVVASEAFRDACLDLRACAETEAERLGPESHEARLRDLGYGDRELDEIRAVNEVFSAGNMPYVLIATRARLLLEGRDWVLGDAMMPWRPEPAAPKPILIEPHHADPTMQALYADIRETLGLPFVNTDYRAFARWPSQFAPAWSDLKAAIEGPAYQPAVGRVHDCAVALAHALPNPTGLTPEALREAARRDAALEEVLSVVRLFQWLLPGLATNVAFLRAQLPGT